MPAYRILVTGSSGAVGKPVCKALLAAGHHVRGLDIARSEELADCHVGSVSDMEAVDKAMETMDTLVHLGAEPNECDFMTRLLPANIVGTYNVMDSARRHNLRRVVLASSMQVMNGLWKKVEYPVKTEYGTAPTNHYGVTKVFAEALGHMYSRSFKMSVIVARIAWLTRNAGEARSMQKSPFSIDFFLSHDDAGRFFLKAVEAENIDFCILVAASKWKTRQLFDLEPAKNLIGYEPQDQFPEGLPFNV